MARSLLLLLALQMATTSAWRYCIPHGAIPQSRRATKRPRPAWSSPLGQGGNGGDGKVIVSGGVGEDRLRASPAGSGDGGSGNGSSEWPTDGRDSLPFVVYDAAPPPRKVGVANLPPLTSTGDTLWHGAKHYKVLRVSSHYKYEGGRFVVRRKSIQAKELKRVAKERMVARLVYGENDGGSGGGSGANPRPPPSS